MSKFKLIKEKLSSIESVVGEKIRNYVGRDLSNDEKITISVLVNGLFESSSMMANLIKADNKHRQSESDYNAAVSGIIVGGIVSIVIPNIFIGIPLSYVAEFLTEELIKAGYRGALREEFVSEFGMTTSEFSKWLEDNNISGADLVSLMQLSDAASEYARCFLAGTSILMADGTTKPIEAIRPGDEVAAFDPDAQQGLGPLRPGKVTRTFTNVTRTIINLRGLHMTPGHVVLMDNGEWDIIARALKDDRAIVEEREGPVGASKATLVRARTGAALGSLEDTSITVVFADPVTGRERHALVRAGIPVKARTLEDGNLELCTMADILTMQDYTIEPDGTILCRDGHRYEATPWADDDVPPDHLPMQQNWILELDGEAYIPPWIADLPMEQEDTGQMVVNASSTAAPAVRPGPRIIL